MSLRNFIPFIFVFAFLANGCDGASEKDSSDSSLTKSLEVDSPSIVRESDSAETSNINVSRDLLSVSADLDTSSELTELKRASGDLNGDRIPELVAVFDNGTETDLGTEREIRIYSQTTGDWALWHRSVGAVLPSQHGGMMGDPFDGLKIKRGSIVIENQGGSRQKWHYTHRYRYQEEDWYLIGATINYGAPCDYWENVDYNLSTGSAIYEKQTEDCGGEDYDVRTYESETKKGKVKLDRLPLMDGFYPGNNSILIPGVEVEQYY